MHRRNTPQEQQDLLDQADYLAKQAGSPLFSSWVSFLASIVFVFLGFWGWFGVVGDLNPAIIMFFVMAFTFLCISGHNSQIVNNLYSDRSILLREYDNNNPHIKRYDEFTGKWG